MTDAKRTGRIVGVMLLVQLVGLMVSFILVTEPLRSAEYLTNASGQSAQIKAAVLVFLATGAVTIGISVMMWPVLREHSQPMAIWLIVLAVIMFVLQAIDNVHILAMMSLSRQFVEGGAPPESYEALAASVRATRRWAHFQVLFAIDAWLLMLYTIVLRFRLVPRALALFAAVTVLIQFFAVPLPGYLEYPMWPNLAPALAIGMLSVAVWLIARGLDRSS
jgi:hypothetical protein